MKKVVLGLLLATNVWAADAPPPKTDQQLNREIGYLIAQRDAVAKQYEILNAQIQEIEAELSKRAGANKQQGSGK